MNQTMDTPPRLPCSSSKHHRCRSSVSPTADIVIPSLVVAPPPPSKHHDETDEDVYDDNDDDGEYSFTPPLEIFVRHLPPQAAVDPREMSTSTAFTEITFDGASSCDPLSRNNSNHSVLSIASSVSSFVMPMSDNDENKNHRSSPQDLHPNPRRARRVVGPRRHLSSDGPIVRRIQRTYSGINSGRPQPPQRTVSSGQLLRRNKGVMRWASVPNQGEDGSIPQPSQTQLCRQYSHESHPNQQSLPNHFSNDHSNSNNSPRLPQRRGSFNISNHSNSSYSPDDELQRQMLQQRRRNSMRSLPRLPTRQKSNGSLYSNLTSNSSDDKGGNNGAAAVTKTTSSGGGGGASRCSTDSFGTDRNQYDTMEADDDSCIVSALAA